jgi:hypothetical protein
LLFLLISGGCARVPWTTPLEGEQSEDTVRFLESGSLRPELCPQSIDGDVSLAYRNIFGKKNISGYFQIISPSFLKFVISNPLGQPVILLTSDQKTFQLINTLKRKYISGSVYSYGLLNDIPSILLKGDWQEWIRGTVSIETSSITDIREDKNDRGTWVTAEGGRDDSFIRTHLLIDPGENVLLERIIEKKGWRGMVKITYSDWVAAGMCRQPTAITMTGLKYQTEIAIKLSDVRPVDKLEGGDQLLTAPPNYPQQIIP